MTEGQVVYPSNSNLRGVIVAPGAQQSLVRFEGRKMLVLMVNDHLEPEYIHKWKTEAV